MRFASGAEVLWRRPEAAEGVVDAMIEAQVDVDERIFGQGWHAGQAQPHVAQNPFTHLRLALQTLSEN